MGTVGINFGSATGGAGFDVASTVSSILAISSGIETPWKTQLTTLAAQDSAFTTLGGDLSDLSTAVGALTDFDGVFSAKDGSSSDTGVLTLSSAGTSAVAGSHTILVKSLASTSSTYSDEIASASDTLSGSISLQVGSGTVQTIAIDATNNTLSTLASAINDGSYGVTASVVSDTSGSRLSLVSKTSGAAGAITSGGTLTDATTATTVGFTIGQPGADAVLSVDGLPTTSASNTVTNAIPGVTFQLLADAPSTPIQIQITNDNGSIETAVASLVTAYNKAVGDIKTQEGNTSTGAAQPLFGDPTLSLLQTQLSTALSAGAASGSIANIQQLGLSVNADGTLTLDNSTLDAALNANFSDVLGCFQNADSFGQTLTSTLNQLGSTSTTGAISLALAQNASTETGLNNNVTNEDTLIAAQKITLTDELNQANQILQSIPQQLDEINQIYSAITGYNTGNS